MTTKKPAYTRTPEQEEQARLKRLERTQRREGGDASSTSTSPSSTNPKGSDYLDGFEQSIGLFGDAQVANGEAGQIFDYNHGQLQLHLANVGGGAVKLMSHFVWNAALVMAEYIESGQVIDVQGKRVIEFGAGAALPGLLCVKRGAAFVTLTDYPDPAIVHNLERNWFENLVETAEEKQERLEVRAESIHTTRYTSLGSSSVDNQERHDCEQRVRCAVRGHAWGESVQEMLSLPGSGSGSPTGYDWILMADTLWVSEGHGALLSSCQAVLSPGGRVLVCCGLHSGFNTVQRFMALARSSTFGFQVRLVEIRRVPQWGETRTAEELRAESAQLKEDDMEKFSVEDRNRTVLVYELWK
ncbi:hypothetical protein BGZ59_009340 [Podila verticillata]|nr:hypothetical protein BGZ59_009340 [Podila verticillata]KFH63255.1 hypothetical protein MVEG_10666 [Podila verticillata NRRL 6337]